MGSRRGRRKDDPSARCNADFVNAGARSSPRAKSIVLTRQQSQRTCVDAPPSRDWVICRLSVSGIGRESDFRLGRLNGRLSWPVTKWVRTLGREPIQPIAVACFFFLSLRFSAQEDRDGTAVLAFG